MSLTKKCPYCCKRVRVVERKATRVKSSMCFVMAAHQINGAECKGSETELHKINAADALLRELAKEPTQ